MLVSEALSLLQNLTNERISQAEIARILNTSPVAINKRISRGSEIKVSEVETLEKHYNLSLISKSSTDDSIELPYYSSVKGSCGFGVKVYDETTEKIPVAKALIKNFSNTKHYSVISAYGNSMQPTIIDEDKLIVEHDMTDIIDGRIYVFRYEDDLFIKRLYKNINKLMIKSDNAKEFPEITLDKTEAQNISVIGQIVGLIRVL